MAVRPPRGEEHALFDYGFKNDNKSVFRTDFGVPRPTTNHDVFAPVSLKCGGLGAGKRSEVLASCRTLARENAYYLDRLNAAAACGELDGVKIVGEIPRLPDWSRRSVQPRFPVSALAAEGCCVKVEKVTRVAEPRRATGAKEVLMLHHPGANADPVTIVKVPFPEGVLEGDGRPDEGKLLGQPCDSSDIGDRIPHPKEGEQEEAQEAGALRRRHHENDAGGVRPAGLPNRMCNDNPITHRPNGARSRRLDVDDAVPDKVTCLRPEHERLHYRYYAEFVPASAKPAGRPVQKDRPIEAFHRRYGGETEEGPPEHVAAVLSEPKGMPDGSCARSTDL